MPHLPLFPLCSPGAVRVSLVTGQKQTVMDDGVFVCFSFCTGLVQAVINWNTLFQSQLSQ